MTKRLLCFLGRHEWERSRNDEGHGSRPANVAARCDAHVVRVARHTSPCSAVVGTRARRNRQGVSPSGRVGCCGSTQGLRPGRLEHGATRAEGSSPPKRPETRLCSGL